MAASNPVVDDGTSAAGGAEGGRSHLGAEPRQSRHRGGCVEPSRRCYVSIGVWREAPRHHPNKGTSAPTTGVESSIGSGIEPSRRCYGSIGVWREASRHHPNKGTSAPTTGVGVLYWGRRRTQSSLLRKHRRLAGGAEAISSRRAVNPVRGGGYTARCILSYGKGVLSRDDAVCRDVYKHVARVAHPDKNPVRNAYYCAVAGVVMDTMQRAHDIVVSSSSSDRRSPRQAHFLRLLRASPVRDGMAHQEIR